MFTVATHRPKRGSEGGDAAEATPVPSTATATTTAATTTPTNHPNDSANHASHAHARTPSPLATLRAGLAALGHHRSPLHRSASASEAPDPPSRTASTLARATTSPPPHISDARAPAPRPRRTSDADPPPQPRIAAEPPHNRDQPRRASSGDGDVQGPPHANATPPPPPNHSTPSPSPSPSPPTSGSVPHHSTSHFSYHGHSYYSQRSEALGAHHSENESSSGHTPHTKHIVDDWRSPELVQALLAEIDAIAHGAARSPHFERRLADLVRGEFPITPKVPSSRALDDAVLRAPPASEDADDADAISYDVGQWVERLHDDMKYHLEPVTRVVHREEVVSDGFVVAEKLYKTSAGVLTADVRCPEEGLKRAFGMRPFMLQQWLLLRMERHTWFLESHERDFENLDLSLLPAKLYAEWLDDPRNADFRALHDSKPRSAQVKLRDFVLGPFTLMNRLVEDERWNPTEDTEGLSVLQYASFLGSGYLTVCAVVALQLLVPTLVLMVAVRSSGRFQLDAGGAFSSVTTTWATFCTHPSELETVGMRFAVWIIYTMRVTPQVLQQFYSTLGDEPTVTGRLTSMRVVVWEQGDDTVWMQVGTKLHRYLKTCYLAAVNLLMLLVVLLQDDAVDVIFNALALDFIVAFDTDIVRAPFFDPGRRFMRAAFVEMLLRAELQLEAMASPAAFARAFDVPGDHPAVQRAVLDPERALRDDADTRWMTTEEKLWHAAGEFAAREGICEALAQFRKPVVAFGAVDRLLRRAGWLRTGVFHRFLEYRTWSTWDALLFAARVPAVGAPSDFATGLPSVRNDARAAAAWAELVRGVREEQEKAERQGPDDATARARAERKRLAKHFKAPEQEPLLNCQPQSSWPPEERFVWQLWCVATFRVGATNVRLAWRRWSKPRVLVALLDSLVEWACTVSLFLFPVAVAAYAVLLTWCQPVLELVEGAHRAARDVAVD